VDNGHICRDFEDEAWAICIPSLIDFAAENGEIVLSVRDRSPHVEIYDAYRE